MNNKPNFLFVCTINKIRSLTAEAIFKDDPRFNVKSCGIKSNARVEINEELVNWSDTIIVMEQLHGEFIRENFPESFSIKKVYCLNIPDDYLFNNPVLIELLSPKINCVFFIDLQSN